MFSFRVPKLTLNRVLDLSPSPGMVIVAPIEIPDVQQSESGLLIVTGDDDVKSQNYPVQFGKVLAVGDDITQYQAGDVIFYHKYSGQDGDMITDRFRMIRLEEIWGTAKVELTQQND